jgi:hypothetical protein
MKSEARLYFSIVCVIVLFDAAASLASRWMKFEYAQLFWVSWCIYSAAGFFALRYRGLRGGALAGLTAGFTDSTVGWAVSSAIGPYTAFRNLEGPLWILVLMVVIPVTLSGAAFGVLGALVRLAVLKVQRQGLVR